MILLYFYNKYDNVSYKIHFAETSAISFRVVNKINVSSWNQLDWETVLIILFILVNPFMMFHEVFTLDSTLQLISSSSVVFWGAAKQIIFAKNFQF